MAVWTPSWLRAAPVPWPAAPIGSSSGRSWSALEPTLRALAAGQAVYPGPLYRALRSAGALQPGEADPRDGGPRVLERRIAAKLVVTERMMKNLRSSAFTWLVRSRTAAASLILDPDTGSGLGVLQIGASTANG